MTAGVPGALAARQATPLIPIVFALVSDPIGAGLVTSLARPGGNATGLSTLQTAIVNKRLKLLREVVPGLQRLAIWANSGNPGNRSNWLRLR